MKFTLATSLLFLIGLTSQSANAFLTGIRIPSNLTPGQIFNVTYYFNSTNSNAQAYQAIFGLSDTPSNFETSKTAIGSEPFTTYDLSNVVFDYNQGYGINVTLTLPGKDYFEIYDQNGNFPNPWLLSSANIEQVGASGGVSLDVFHAETTINY